MPPLTERVYDRRRRLWAAALVAAHRSYHQPRLTAGSHLQVAATGGPHSAARAGRAVPQARFSFRLDAVVSAAAPPVAGKGRSSEAAPSAPAAPAFLTERASRHGARRTCVARKAGRRAPAPARVRAPERRSPARLLRTTRGSHRSRDRAIAPRDKQPFVVSSRQRAAASAKGDTLSVWPGCSPRRSGCNWRSGRRSPSA